MKNAGLFGVLTQNIVYKVQRWNRFHLETSDEQINLVFSVMLFLMEYSLREQPCTVDDVAVFVDTVCATDLGKGLTFDESRDLADFIVNTILSNDGEQMEFRGFDFESNVYTVIPIRYVTNEVVYLEGEVKRTSYHLTDDGYNLLLSTLEIESNMRLTVQELLFRLQMEKQDYDRAVDTVKDIFDTIRRQLQRIREAMVRVRRNALNYSVAEYETIVHENLDSLTDTSRRFESFRELVARRRAEIDEIRINERNLSEEETRNLKDLGVIGTYLDRVIEEHQKILQGHFELKALYTRELENLSRVSQIRRFSFREKIYEPVLKDPEILREMGEILSPLFRGDPDKTYNVATAAALQRPMRSRRDEEVTEEVDLDTEEWEREQERLRKEKQQKYETCLKFILETAVEKGEISLSEIKQMLAERPEDTKKLIPGIDIFKEVMVELIKSSELDVAKLRKERSMSFVETEGGFAVNVAVLELLDVISGGDKVGLIRIFKNGNGKVTFEDIEAEDGTLRNIRCTEVKISVTRDNGEPDSGG